MELDREWTDNNGVTHDEELMNFCEDLPYKQRRYQ